MKLANTSIYLALSAVLVTLYTVLAFSEPCKHPRLPFLATANSRILVPTEKPNCFHWWNNHHEEPHDHPEPAHHEYLRGQEFRRRKKYRL